MTGASWFAGYLVFTWVIGYGLGYIFSSVRKFIEKTK